jgi:hypothetical protein
LGKRLNIDAVLGKPFSPKELQEALVEVFPGGYAFMPPK